MDKKTCVLYNGRAWYLEISSPEELKEYLDIVRAARGRKLENNLERAVKGEHMTDVMPPVCKTLASIRGTDAQVEFYALRQKQRRDMSHMIKEGYVLYVNPASRYCLSPDAVINWCEHLSVEWPVFKKKNPTSG